MKKGRYENLPEGVKWLIGIVMAALVTLLIGVFTGIPTSTVAQASMTVAVIFAIVYGATRAAVIDFNRSKLNELKNVVAAQCPWYNRGFDPKEETCRKCVVASMCESKSEERKNVAAAECPWYGRNFDPRKEICSECAAAADCRSKSEERKNDADN